jgi:hypothetical protein
LLITALSQVVVVVVVVAVDLLEVRVAAELDVKLVVVLTMVRSQPVVQVRALVAKVEPEVQQDQQVQIVPILVV